MAFLLRTIAIFTVSIILVALYGCEKSGKKNTEKQRTAAITAIKKITKDQFYIENHFDVEGRNMTGYVAEPKHGGQPVLFFSNNQNGDIIYGVLFDKNGENITDQYLDQHVKPILAKKTFQDVEHVKWFLVGQEDAPHQIYMVGEPNCSICHKLYKAFRPFIEKGELSIRWIVVAFLKPDSQGKAAAILQSSNPAVALAQNENSHFNTKKEEGALFPLSEDKITEHTKEELKTNMTFMNQASIRGTPVIFYKDLQGEMQRIDGYPQKDIEDLIKTIDTLPTNESLSEK